MFKKNLLPFNFTALIFSMGIFITSCGDDEPDPTAEVCNNSVDDDGDGQTDCDDPDCATNNACVENPNFTASDYAGTFIDSHRVSIIGFEGLIPPIADTLIVAASGNQDDTNSCDKWRFGFNIQGEINRDNGKIKFKSFTADSILIVDSHPDSLIWVKNINANGITANSFLSQDKNTLNVQIKVTGKAYGLSTIGPFPEPFNIVSALDARLSGAFIRQQ